ncbi:hypothetical protein MBLNU457_4111t2 [Dothideomycetes sp. NU457]
MSAEDLGKRLVAEIEEERFDELLFTLRTIKDPESSTRTGVDAIDELLAVFSGSTKPPDEQDARDVLTRSAQVTRRRPPPFIELTSPSSGNGKCHLLYYLVAVAVLPRHLHSTFIGGHDGATIVMDNDNRFSVPRLIQIMQHLMNNKIAQAKMSSASETQLPTSKDADGAIEAALSHVHIFRPQSMESLLATITNLRDYVFDPESHYSSHKRIHSIMLSSASAFYWQDRCDMDTAAALSTTSASGTTNLKPRSGYIQLATSLRSISAELSCPVIYTTWTTSSVQPGSTAIRPSLPNPWPTLPFLRLVVQRRPVRKLPGAISAEEALRDRKDRSEAVAEGWFDVSVNGYNSEEWTDGVRESLKRMGGGGGFAMRIWQEGVNIDSR